MAGNTKFWNKFRTNFEKYLWTNLKKNYFDRKKEYYNPRTPMTIEEVILSDLNLSEILNNFFLMKTLER